MPQMSCLTSLGEITLSEEAGAIVALDWGRGRDLGDTPLLNKATRQLQSYLAGKRRVFDLPLAPQGSAFQRKVWKALQKIPYGTTLSYGELAHKLNTAPRALGRACATNPIPIIIPCHRVISEAGFGGYSGEGGVDAKIALLKLEGALL